ncbi:MAG: DUF3368 domain-containing protein [Acidobacteriota bacterium]
MKEPVVSDSACLIGLERIGQLDLLPTLFTPIFIPPAVNSEFGISLNWLTIEAPADQLLVDALKILVDDGEAEAIALAKEQGCKVILDDKQARAVANRLGLSIIGTIGILVQTRLNGTIAQLKPLLDDLDSQGFYISRALREEALRIVGEK